MMSVYELSYLFRMLFTDTDTDTGDRNSPNIFIQIRMCGYWYGDMDSGRIDFKHREIKHLKKHNKLC